MEVHLISRCVGVWGGLGGGGGYVSNEKMGNVREEFKKEGGTSSSHCSSE